LAYAVFWVCLLVVAFVYLGYPLLLWIWSSLARRPVRRRHFEPEVSLVIAVHNERNNIGPRIENCLALDYPRHKLQIIVSLDAPSDGTDILAEKYIRQGVKVVHSTTHQGKAAAINRAVLHATGRILMFADARQTFAPDVVRQLMANFSDPAVGVASGELVLLDDRKHEASDGAGLYWRYEKKLRVMESAIHSVLGATGAVYAMRRELFSPMEHGTILDDVASPMRAVLAGYRSVFDPNARAYDRVSETPEEEYRRKVRTLTGNYQLLAQIPDLLVPWRNPVFFQFATHKVGRLIAPYFLAALFLSNLFLLHGPYLITLALQSCWYGLVLIGMAVSRFRNSPARPATGAWGTWEA
jgi:poly-beta-1,6-N-acetyl-D-glucosamine synthase